MPPLSLVISTFFVSIMLVLIIQADRVFEVRGRFDRFYYWNLQNRPTTDDKVLQALKCTGIAQAVSVVS